ncbi:MAG: DinB family protein [Gemmatimonadota bacterium]|jgi:uncharacterized damage-inducible protein DinB
MYRLRVAALLAAVLPLALIPPSAAAQMGSNPVADALRGNLERSARNMVAAAKAMPGDKYGFKPTDPQNSFGHIVSHVAGSNNFLCSTVSGMDAPQAQVPDGDASKDDLVAAMQTSYDYCSKALAGLTDAQLSDMVPYFGNRQVTRATAVLGLSDDWADHYGQLAMYLRLNGILPPTARRGMDR